MRNIAMLLVFTLGTPLVEPQNLPTTGQCAADLHAWYLTREKDAQKLGVDDLTVRIAEMSACKGLAVSGLPEYKTLADDFLKYDTLMGTYDRAYTLRLFHFIKRHGKLAQFAREDAAGKR